MCRILEYVNRIIQHDALKFINDIGKSQLKQVNINGFVQDYEAKNKKLNTTNEKRKLIIELDLFSVFIKLQEALVNKYIQLNIIESLKTEIKETETKIKNLKQAEVEGDNVDNTQ